MRSPCDNDPRVVYLGHTLMGLEEYEARMRTNDQKVDVPGLLNDPMKVYVSPNTNFDQFKIGDWPLDDSWKSPGIIPGHIGPQINSPIMTYTNYVSYVDAPKWREWRDAVQLCLSVDLPGVEQKDIKITIESGIIRVEYQRIDEGALKTTAHVVNALDYDVHSAKASFRACILTVRLNAIQKPIPEKIEVEIGD